MEMSTIINKEVEREIRKFGETKLNLYFIVCVLVKQIYTSITFGQR